MSSFLGFGLHIFSFPTPLIPGLASGVVAAPRLRADAVVRPPARPQLRRRHRDQQTADQRGDAGLRHAGVQGYECYLARQPRSLYSPAEGSGEPRPGLGGPVSQQQRPLPLLKITIDQYFELLFRVLCVFTFLCDFNCVSCIRAAVTKVEVKYCVVKK